MKIDIDMCNPTEIRAVLEKNQAILVHFSTVMGRPEIGYPEDLQGALTLSGVELSFSTIQIGDTWRMAKNFETGGEGSVGILVDIGDKTTVTSVYHDDSGSNDCGSMGNPPTIENCQDSIDKRSESNEWRLRDYKPIGIFVIEPIWVPRITPQSGRKEYEAGIGDILENFPEINIFSVGRNSFLKFDKATMNWAEITYESILASNI